jgi:hypothetical protein
VIRVAARTIDSFFYAGRSFNPSADCQTGEEIGNYATVNRTRRPGVEDFAELTGKGRAQLGMG